MIPPADVIRSAFARAVTLSRHYPLTLHSAYISEQTSVTAQQRLDLIHGACSICCRDPLTVDRACSRPNDARRPLTIPRSLQESGHRFKHQPETCRQDPSSGPSLSLSSACQACARHDLLQGRAKQLPTDLGPMQSHPRRLCCASVDACNMTEIYLQTTTGLMASLTVHLQNHGSDQVGQGNPQQQGGSDATQQRGRGGKARVG